MWTDQSTTLSTWSDSSNRRQIVIGNPIGLLLTLTYAVDITIETSWTDSTTGLASWTDQTVNQPIWNTQSINTTNWS